jgi:hypothetical protein
MMSEKRIEEIAAEVASPASRYLPYWRTAVDFARAIEAECRKVPAGYVPVPVEPTASQLDVAVSFALNVKLCNDYNWSAYMRDVYARMLAAAPKPEKAEPDCECGAVASEHCPACEPVAQEPFGIWHQGDTEEESDFFLFKDSGDVSCPNCIKLYTAPPDLAAEVERLAEQCRDFAAQAETDAGVIKADGKEIHYLRERIAELERQRNRLVTALQAETGMLVACEKRQAVLVEALEEAREEVVGWAAYASEYFQQKHNLQGYVEKLDTTLASVKGNAEVTGVTTGENDAT